MLPILAAGRSNQAIARELVVTLDTVERYVSHVLGKLGAANRTESVARARELSLHALTRRLSHGRAAGSGTRCRVETGPRCRQGPAQLRASQLGRGHYIPTPARHKRRARLHLGARCPPEDSTRMSPSG